MSKNEWHQRFREIQLYTNRICSRARLTGAIGSDATSHLIEGYSGKQVQCARETVEGRFSHYFRKREHQVDGVALRGIWTTETLIPGSERREGVMSSRASKLWLELVVLRPICKVGSTRWHRGTCFGGITEWGCDIPRWWTGPGDVAVSAPFQDRQYWTCCCCCWLGRFLHFLFFPDISWSSLDIELEGFMFFKIHILPSMKILRYFTTLPLVINSSEDEHVQNEKRTAYCNSDAQGSGILWKRLSTRRIISGIKDVFTEKSTNATSSPSVVQKWRESVIKQRVVPLKSLKRKACKLIIY